MTHPSRSPRALRTVRTVPTTCHKNRGGTLIGLFFGLLLGLLCAFGVAWYLNKTPLPFVDKALRTDKPAGDPATQAPQALPGKPGEKTAAAPGSGDKPRFDFYKMLPAGQDAGQLPANPPAQPADKAAPDAAQAVTETFYLQAGAFQKAAEADNLKAKLALMGLETNVMEGKVPEKGVVYRVRVGPYGTLDEMNRVRNQLAQNRIQTTVVKTRETAGTAESTTDGANR